MTLQSSFILLLIISSLNSLIVVFYALKHRRVVGSYSFAVLLLGEFIWAIGYIFEILADTSQGKLFWDNIQYLGLDLTTVGIFTFAINYTTYSLRYRKLLLLFYIEPAISLIMFWYKPFEKFVRPSYQICLDGLFPSLTYEYGVWVWITFAYNYLLVFACIVILLVHFIRSHTIYRLQLGMIITGIIIPLIGTFITISGLVPIQSMRNLDIVLITFPIANAFWSWGIFRYNLLSIVPIARNSLIDQMNIATIVLDLNKKIIDFNSMASKVFNLREKCVIGRSISQVLPDLAEICKQCVGNESIHREINGISHLEASKFYAINITPLKAKRGNMMGRLISIQDITKQKKTEQKLIRSNKRYSNLAVNIPGMLYQLVMHNDKKIKLLYISPACNKVLGVTSEQAKNDMESILEIIYSDDLISFYKSMKISAEAVQPWHWTGRVIVSGKIRWLQNDSVPEKQSDGSIIWDGIVVDITSQKNTEQEIKVLNEELKHISFTDSLTGAFNRRKIMELGEKEIHMTTLNKQQLSICMGDIDHFKKINDTWEHSVGLFNKRC